MSKKEALRLINTAIRHSILDERDYGVYIYKKANGLKSEGWYLIDKGEFAEDVMQNSEYQKYLIEAINKKIA